VCAAGFAGAAALRAGGCAGRSVASRGFDGAS
jgi:hypothetical protein